MSRRNILSSLRLRRIRCTTGRYEAVDAKISAESNARDVLESSAEHVLVLDSFLEPGTASRLRGVFDEKQSKPREGTPERFVWDWWHVPDQYTLVRSHPRSVISNIEAGLASVKNTGGNTHFGGLLPNIRIASLLSALGLIHRHEHDDIWKMCEQGTLYYLNRVLVAAARPLLLSCVAKFAGLQKYDVMTVIGLGIMNDAITSTLPRPQRCVLQLRTTSTVRPFQNSLKSSPGSGRRSSAARQFPLRGSAYTWTAASKGSTLTPGTVHGLTCSRLPVSTSHARGNIWGMKFFGITVHAAYAA